MTTGGGIEEDIMKCFNPHYMGDFALKGRELRKKGLNRIGNLIVPNKNYCSFEDWIRPILAQASGVLCLFFYHLRRTLTGVLLFGW